MRERGSEGEPNANNLLVETPESWVELRKEVFSGHNLGILRRIALSAWEDNKRPLGELALAVDCFEDVAFPRRINCLGQICELETATKEVFPSGRFYSAEGDYWLPGRPDTFLTLRLVAQEPIQATPPEAPRSERSIIPGSRLSIGAEKQLLKEGIVFFHQVRAGENIISQALGEEEEVFIASETRRAQIGGQAVEGVMLVKDPVISFKDNSKREVQASVRLDQQRIVVVDGNRFSGSFAAMCRMLPLILPLTGSYEVCCEPLGEAADWGQAPPDQANSTGWLRVDFR